MFDTTTYSLPIDLCGAFVKRMSHDAVLRIVVDILCSVVSLLMACFGSFYWRFISGAVNTFMALGKLGFCFGSYL